MKILKDNKIIKKINNLKKRCYLKKVTDGLGEVIEEDNRFVCNVNKKIIKKKFKDFVCVSLYLKSYDRYFKNMKNSSEFANSDKPIYYIFDGVEFDGLVLSAAADVRVIFKNCLFKKYVNVTGCKKVTFENNKYYNRNSIYSHCNNGKFFVVRADSVNFEYETFYNRDEQHHVCQFGMDIICDELSVMHSWFSVDNSVKVNDYRCGNEYGDVSFNTKNLLIYMSNIEAPNIFIETDTIIVDEESELCASKGFMIDTLSNSYFSSIIDTPYLVYNGINLKNNDNNTNIIKKELKIQMSRVKLIEILKNIRDEANKINQERLNRIMDVVKEDLDSKRLKRVLRKKEDSFG